MAEVETVGIFSGIVAGFAGVGTWIGKTVFVTKKDLNFMQAQCQASICKKLDEYAADTKALSEKQIALNVEIAGFMGAVTQFIEDHDKRIDRARD